MEEEICARLCCIATRHNLPLKMLHDRRMQQGCLTARFDYMNCKLPRTGIRRHG